MDVTKDPYSVAVAAIRMRMRSGRLVQGEQLMVSELARDLKLSATPVREALARLAGEGLIEDRRGAGYFAWRLDAVDLAELYELQAAYFRTALLRSADGLAPAAVEGMNWPSLQEDPILAMEAQLAKLVQRGRSVVLQRAQAVLADRLAPARRVEPVVIPDPSAEWEALDRALQAGPGYALWNWTEAYVESRRLLAGDLVGAMRSAAGG